MIPLRLKIKRKAHQDIAYAQDMIVEELYNFFPNAVIHGGTAIWRCYNGNRFSEDIDVYINKDEDAIKSLFRALEKKGFAVIKERIKENSLYSELIFNMTPVRFEAIFKRVDNFVLKEYETSESLFINVYTLSPESLILEKVEACLKRKKIRDLYDIFFLLRHVNDRKKVANSLQRLIKNFARPEDEENLKVLVISGPVPDSKKLLEYIQTWAK